MSGRTGRYINGLGQECFNSIANALALLQLCTKPMIYTFAVYMIKKTKTTSP